MFGFPAPMPPEQVKIFMDRFEEKYTIPDIINFLNELHLGGEQAWFGRLKGMIRELLADQPETQVQVIGMINFGQCVTLAFPRIFHLVNSGMVFILGTLEHLKITRLQETKNMDPDTVWLFYKIISTVFVACSRIVGANKSKLFGREPWETVSFTEDLRKMKSPGGLPMPKIVDEGTWKEFMTFLSGRRDVMNPPQEACCIQ